MRLPVISRNTGVIVLAAAAIAGASANWWLLTSPIDVTPTVERSGQSAVSTPLVLLPATVATDLPETVTRPVFSATRRPPEPKSGAQAEQPVVAAATAPETLELRGIMRHSRKGVAALIRSNANLPGSWVRVGESVDGWLVREIREDGATVETNGQRFELQISYRGRSPTGP